MINNLSLRTNVKHLISLLEKYPDLLANIQPPREPTMLTKRPKTGEKTHNGKPKFKRPIDYEAVDLKTDLIKAYNDGDFEGMARNYYTLAHLLSYI